MSFCVCVPLFFLNWKKVQGGRLKNNFWPYKSINFGNLLFAFQLHMIFFFLCYRAADQAWKGSQSKADQSCWSWCLHDSTPFKCIRRYHFLKFFQCFNFPCFNFFADSRQRKFVYFCVHEWGASCWGDMGLTLCSDSHIILLKPKYQRHFSIYVSKLSGSSSIFHGT